MANPNPSLTTRFRKGNPGGGRRRGRIRADDVKRLVGKFWHMSLPDLLEYVQRGDAPMGEMMIASIMFQVIKSGDANRLALLLDRAIGRPKEPDDDKKAATEFTFKLAYKE